ncbi:unnamed protein product [Boreogadus saida]
MLTYLLILVGKLKKIKTIHISSQLSAPQSPLLPQVEVNRLRALLSQLLPISPRVSQRLSTSPRVPQTSLNISKKSPRVPLTSGRVPQWSALGLPEVSKHPPNVSRCNRVRSVCTDISPRVHPCLPESPLVSGGCSRFLQSLPYQDILLLNPFLSS